MTDEDVTELLKKAQPVQETYNEVADELRDLHNQLQEVIDEINEGKTLKTRPLIKKRHKLEKDIADLEEEEALLNERLTDFKANSRRIQNQLSKNILSKTMKPAYRSMSVFKRKLLHWLMICKTLLTKKRQHTQLGNRINGQR
ncbi:hypothetical protein [Actinoplanes cyaneus]|uniref:hypothetical protein n=1 Tax=Actinoplanes cyaneus TaxID=52696 RepID=UPI0031DF8239